MDNGKDTSVLSVVSVLFHRSVRSVRSVRQRGSGTFATFPTSTPYEICIPDSPRAPRVPPSRGGAKRGNLVGAGTTMERRSSRGPAKANSQTDSGAEQRRSLPTHKLCRRLLRVWVTPEVLRDLPRAIPPSRPHFSVPPCAPWYGRFRTATIGHVFSESSDTPVLGTFKHVEA